MSGPNQRLSSEPHRAPHPAIWAAAAAVILLALVACASTTANPTPTASVFGASSHTGTLTGAGSTFVAPFSTWPSPTITCRTPG